MSGLRRVCVFCGSSTGHDPRHAAAAAAMGRALVAADLELVYGGGAVGLMGIVADAAMQAGGRVTGVIPRGLFRREVRHEAITELHETNSMHERKALMYELSDAFVAMPGGIGTMEELFETLTWAQIGLHAKPVGVLDVNGFYQPLLGFLQQMVAGGFVKPRHVDAIVAEQDPVRLLAALAAVAPSEDTHRVDPTRI